MNKDKQKNKAFLTFFKIFSIILIIAVVCLVGYLCYRFISEPKEFSAWIRSHGMWGYLVYIGITVLQIIVTVIPGGPLELAGGYAFGAFWGTVLFVIGAFIGSLISFGLVRKFGRDLVETQFSKKQIKKLAFLEDEEKLNFVFMILFIIPGCPKDLLCYVAGLTRMKLSAFCVIATLGRLPAVIGTAVGGQAIEAGNYLMAVVAFAVTAAVSLAGLLIYTAIVKRKNSKKDQAITEDAA
ncbi:MAG: TVP38/TMEM64 family protein [Clostridiales bacterium]|nr:TVP38/TMEM64 family protein [Clostridiales bacterium]